MKFVSARIQLQLCNGLLLATGLALAAGPAVADKPSWAGKDKEHKEGKRKDRHDEDDRRGGRASEHKRSGHFGEDKKRAVHAYYEHEGRAGRCPPGLAKKDNGCMPPGLARKWVVGKNLPRDVVFHDVPRSLVVQIGLPPAGQRYVRVAADLLLIAVGTGMVLDAIEDLGRQ